MSRLDGDNEQSVANVPFPTGAQAAGIIWMVFGTTTVMGSILGFITGKADATCGCCGILIPIAFAIVGLQTFNGEATGLLNNAIGSIIFGLLYGAGSIAVMSSTQQVEEFAAGALIAGFSIALLAAGLMALASRGYYDRWRQAKLLASETRPLSDEERDYDDEYRP